MPTEIAPPVVNGFVADAAAKNAILKFVNTTRGPLTVISRVLPAVAIASGPTIGGPVSGKKVY